MNTTRLLTAAVCCLQLVLLGEPALQDPWSEVPGILERIQPPKIAARTFSVACPRPGANCTQLLNQTIETCRKQGGGKVALAAGEYLTGPIRLRSGVELHLAKGAVLRFKTDPDAYLPAVLTTFEGMDCYNYSPLIYALDEENIAITGEGLLDGQAEDANWWQWKGKNPANPANQKPARDRLIRQVEAGTPVEERRFGTGDFLRPSFIEFNRCRNVLVEGVSIRRSPMWEIHPLLCTNVIVRKVSISSHGPNNDGCNPESCRDVLIENCTFDTGDDCIAIKSGRNNDGRRRAVPSENIIVRGCVMKDGHGGVVIGSEISGGCSNVFVENCRMDSPNLDRALRIKSNAVRGGVVENVFMRNVSVGTLADALLQIDLLYEEGARGAHKPIVRGVVLDRIQVENAPRAVNVAGFPGAEIGGIIIRKCSFKRLTQPDIIKLADVRFEDCIGLLPSRP